MTTASEQKFKITQSNYNRMSRWYDWVEGWGESRICNASLQILNVQRGEKILEIGSGTGSNLVKAIRKVETGMAVGLDISLEMCQTAKLKIKRKVGIGAAVLVNGNAIALPFADGSFDAVFMLFSLEIIPQDFIPQTLAEIKRMLTRQGRICITSMANKPTHSLTMRLYRWSCTTFPNIVDCQPIILDVTIDQGGFIITQSIERSLWGLPVQTVCAKKRS